MENVLTLLRDYGRFRELEAQLPDQQQQLKEEKYRLREAGGRIAQAKWELDKLEKGGFFQRLLGNQEEKKKKAHRTYRDALAEERSARQALETLTKALAEAEQEHKALCGSWEEYLRAKQTYLADGGDVQALNDEMRPILTAIAIHEINGCLFSLEAALPWMREDVRRRSISPDNQKLEFLGNARTYAEFALRLLEQLPEGSVEIPLYLRSPDGFIMGVTSLYKQLDRLNLAQEQLHRLKARLREL